MDSLRARWARVNYAEKPIGLPVSDYQDQEYSAIVYGRGPLFLFARKLWDCRVDGLDIYMAMASLHVQAFERKWLDGGEASGESQLGTSDLQSLADLTNSLNVVSGIRLAPGGVRIALWLAVSVIVPMLPLVLLRYPVVEVAKVLFRTLFGL